jgi:phospholipase/carboxylesterase
MVPRTIYHAAKEQPARSRLRLERVNSLVTFLETDYGILTEQIALAGFSQGACLTAEYVKRHPKRYLGVAIYSGGLIGEEVEVSMHVEGSLAGTPVYLGCDEEDFHIPSERVRMTAGYLTEHGAKVTLRLYTQLGHTIHGEGLDFLKEVLG